MIRLAKKRLLLGVVFLIFVLELLGRGAFWPERNWDEIPYVFLAGHDVCRRVDHQGVYDLLESRLDYYRQEDLRLRSQAAPEFDKRAIEDTGYFCSNLPFYTAKKFYVQSLRWLTSGGFDPILSVRLMSVIPGILAFIGVGLLVIYAFPGAGILPKLIGLWVLRFCSIDLLTLSTPDALGVFLSSMASMLLLLEVDAGLRQPSARFCLSRGLPVYGSAFVMSLAILARPNLLILALGIALVLCALGSTLAAIVFLAMSLALASIVGLPLHHLVHNIPDGYSFFTMYQYLVGIQYGPGLPGESIRDVGFWGFVSSVFGSWESFILALRTEIDVLSQGFALMAGVILLLGAAGLRSVAWRGRWEALVTLLWRRSYGASVMIFGLSFLTQIFLFPNVDNRMMAPYVYAMIIFICAWAKNSPSESKSINVSIP